MLAQTRSQREEYQQIMRRKEQDVRSWIGKTLDGTEEYNVELTHDGIGLRVSFRSLRAKQLLLNLHRDEFSPSFAMSSPTLDEQGVWSAWFGYSEPLETPRYISAW